MSKEEIKHNKLVSQFDVVKDSPQKHGIYGDDNNIHTEKVLRDYGYFDNKNNDRIICLNVSRTYHSCERPNLYECTRKYWRLCGKRAQNADFVFAVCSGYIVGVFKPIRWYLTASEKHKGRWEFDGEEICDSPFLNMSISHLTAKRQNPVMYLNM